MGRKVKKYEHEMEIIRSLKPGNSRVFKCEYPRGFASKVYECIHTMRKNFGEYYVSIYGINNVMVTRIPKPITIFVKD